MTIKKLNGTECGTEIAKKINEIIDSGGSGYEVGDIVIRSTPTNDAGKHLFDGAKFSGDGIYSAFVNYIAGLVTNHPCLFVTESDWQTAVTTYGVCGKFVYDSTNNTVRLPKITGIIEGTTDLTALGDLIEAGLPNITGSCGSFRCGGNNTSGALYLTSTATVGGGTGGAGFNANIDASRSNSIYNNSNTVQPQTIKVLYYIVVATTTKTDIEVDIDNIATDLNGKADTDLTNITDTAKIMMAHNAMPSNTYVDLTLGASDTVYTAPADGWFSVDKVAGSDWYTIYLQTLDENNNVLLSQTIVGYRTTELKGCLPVRKGQKFKMWYNASGTTNYFRFIYAVGSESEAQ